MENFYQKYQNCHTYLKEYFNDSEYDKKDFAYHNIYIPFIKKYLPVIIKREINNYKEDNLESINTEIITNPITFEVEREITTYLIEDDKFVISMWHYNDVISMIKNFLSFYNLNIKEMTIKELIDSYYMELQRIDYEKDHKEYVINYYKEIANKSNENSEYLTYCEEIYEDIFLKQFIPLLINNKILNINNDSNWDYMSINFEINSGEETTIDGEVLTIDKKYYDKVLLLIGSFIKDYELKSLNSNSEEIKDFHISSLKKLVDAYYMELQRLEYIKEDMMKK